MLSRAIIQIYLVLAVVLFLGAIESKAVTLIDDGEPAGVIIVAEKPTIAANLAAHELQYHIEAITGAVLPIRSDDKETSGIRILVGESAATRKLGLKSEDFKPQEYLIKIDEDTVILMGRDWLDTPENRAEVGRGISESVQGTRDTINYSVAIGRDNEEKPVTLELPGLMDDQGTCYAVYDFLERFCGVHWYGPALFNVVIPSKKTLTVSPETIRRMPSMLHRCAPGGGWPILRKQWGKHHDVQKKLFLRRIRYGGERWGCNHSFSSYYDRFLNKDSKSFERYEPGFFAVGYENEGRWRQLCYTNPELVKQVAQDACDYFDGKGLKGNQIAIGDYFSIVPEDSDHWCKCDKCQAILEKNKSLKTGYFGSGEASDYMFGFINAVAKEVKKTHPDKYIAALAYWCYSYPPTFEVESNVAVAPCMLINDAYKGSIKNDAKFYNLWVEESKRSGRPLHVWNYFHWPMEQAIIRKFKCFPNFMPDVISDWVKRYSREGIRGFYLCGVPQQLEYCLYMQTAFDAYTDYLKYTDEFFSSYFGAAGEPMKKFYWVISDRNRRLRKMGSDEDTSWGKLGTKECMDELGALMDEAIKLASTDLEKQRVESWRRALWEYMSEGRQQYLVRKTKESMLSQLQPLRLELEKGASELPHHFEFTLSNPYDLTVMGDLIWQIPKESPWNITDRIPTNLVNIVCIQPNEQLTFTLVAPKGADLNDQETYQPLPKLELKLKASGESLFEDGQVVDVVLDSWPYAANRQKAEGAFNIGAVKSVAVIADSQSLMLEFKNHLEWGVRESLSWTFPKGCCWKVQPESKKIELAPGETKQVEFKVSFAGTYKDVYPVAQLNRRTVSEDMEIVNKTYRLPVIISPEVEQVLREQSRTASCVRRDGPSITDMPITIDGRLDEMLWQRCPVADGMTLLGGKSGRADDQTQARFAYDDENLYASFVCHDSDLSDLVTNIKAHDGNIWYDDCVEFCLDTNLDKKSCYLITMNANGVVLDVETDTNSQRIVSWDGVGDIKAGRWKDAWVLEVAIPWKNMGMDKPKKGTKLGMNFCRHQPNNSNYRNEAWSQWSVTFEKTNYVPQRFGILVLD